ncbi:thioesterase family protein [Canibacter zhoujuaniae]|nr:thioesterase family protein [Canibacter zhoujuaniae]
MPMHMLPRILFHIFRGRTKSKLGLFDVAKARFRVWPTDLDILVHMNNGKYLSVLDSARIEYTIRSGFWDIFKQQGWYTVVGAQTISYRKSLDPFQKFSIETRVIGFDERACYIEQRFLRKGEIYARAYIQARILRKSGGTVSMQELGEVGNFDVTAHPIPKELAAWANAVRLPSTRTPAPSIWD